MSRNSLKIAAAITLALCAAGANARDLNDMFSVRGYGTLAVAHSSEDRADFVNNTHLQSEGVGFTDEWSTELDSKAGVQFDMRFSERWSAVIQIVSQDGYSNSWDGKTQNDEYAPSLEWANLSYRVTDDLTLRAGRVVLPFLMLSDSARVGFANHWLRAPIEAYGELPFFTSDGGDVSYRSHVGSAVNTLRGHYGTQKQVRDDANNDVTLWGVNNTVEIGALMVRAAYLNVEFQSTSQRMSGLFLGFAGLADALGQTDAANAARRLETIYNTAHAQEVELVNFGVSYDASDWFVMSEANRVMSDGIQIGSWAGYVSGGVRRGAFTPYLTLSRSKSDHRNETLVPLGGLAAMQGQPLPPDVAGMAAQALGMGGGINGMVGMFIGLNGQTTTALGMRWDFRSNFALKAQYDYIDLDEGSQGRFANPQTGFEPGSTVSLFSLALDYVF